MFTTAFRDKILSTLRGTTLSSWTGYIGLIKGITDFRAGTVTEAAYTGYGTRPSATFGAPANTSPVGGRQISNSGAVTFPANTGSNEDQLGFGVYTAATSGELEAIGFLDALPPIVGTVDTLANDKITAYAHGLAVNHRVYVLAAPGALLPAGVSENTAYFVGTVPDADHFTLSTTTGNGNPVDITAGGAALFMPYQVVTVAGGATPEFAIGALVIQI